MEYMIATTNEHEKKLAQYFVFFLHVSTIADVCCDYFLLACL